MGLKFLAITYSRATYRSTTIGDAAFNDRVRNGNGWNNRTVDHQRSRTKISSAIPADR